MTTNLIITVKFKSSNMFLCYSKTLALLPILICSIQESKPQHVQDLEYQRFFPIWKWQTDYFKRIVDGLPLLESIDNCRCPRVYIPVCASDGRTYTNICWMNCRNKTRPRKKSTLVQMGLCYQFLDIEYRKK